MQDSLKGLLITVTLILIFITCILNFIILFPKGQGVVFNDAQSQNAYLNISNSADLGTSDNLEILSNSSTNAFDSWDVTQGFMGTNSMKQGQTGVGTSVTQIFDNLKIIATLLFTYQKDGKTIISPILYVLGLLSTLAGIVVIYYIYAFVRSGR